MRATCVTLLKMLHMLHAWDPDYRFQSMIEKKVDHQPPVFIV